VARLTWNVAAISARNGVVHLLGLVELALGELGAASADPAASASGGQPIEGAVDDGFAVELGERGNDAEEQPADRGGGVDALVQHDEVELAGLEPGGQVEQVLMVAADALQTGDDHLVAGLQACHQLVEVWAGGEFAGCLVDADPVGVDAGARERVDCSTLVLCTALPTLASARFPRL
jgi:hypothetical protein